MLIRDCIGFRYPMVRMQRAGTVGDPRWARTTNLPLRRLVLYPVELRGRCRGAPDLAAGISASTGRCVCNRNCPRKRSCAAPAPSARTRGTECRGARRRRPLPLRSRNAGAIAASCRSTRSSPSAVRPGAASPARTRAAIPLSWPDPTASRCEPACRCVRP